MTNQLLLRPPEEMKNWLFNTAKKRGLTVNSLANQIFWEYKRKLETKQIDTYTAEH